MRSSAPNYRIIPQIPPLPDPLQKLQEILLTYYSSRDLPFPVLTLPNQSTFVPCSWAAYPIEPALGADNVSSMMWPLCNMVVVNTHNSHHGDTMASHACHVTCEAFGCHPVIHLRNASQHKPWRSLVTPSLNTSHGHSPKQGTPSHRRFEPQQF